MRNSKTIVVCNGALTCANGTSERPPVFAPDSNVWHKSYVYCEQARPHSWNYSNCTCVRYCSLFCLEGNRRCLRVKEDKHEKRKM